MKLHFTASDHEDAKTRLKTLQARYGQATLADADMMVVLGGDGKMLHALRESIAYDIPVFGLNCGRIGFLMNEYGDDTQLMDRLEQAVHAPLHPLEMQAIDAEGRSHHALAINEVSLLRQTHSAAHCRIWVNDKCEMEQLVCDGIMVATPAGSTAYNLSAHGPIIPIGTELLALTPISAFRPRRWRGALLPATSKVRIEILDADFRPQSVSADGTEIRDVQEVHIAQAAHISMKLLYDPGASLADRSIREQFMS